MPYGLTQSGDLERDSEQWFENADLDAEAGSTDFTLETWIKFESLPASTAYYTIGGLWGGTGSSFLFQFFNDAGTHKLTCYVNDPLDNNEQYVKASGTLSTGTWYHVAFSWDASASTGEFFLNGASLGTDTKTKTSFKDPGNSTFGIGATTGTTQEFDGRVSLFRVWTATRTATQINDNKCLVLGATASLIAEWTLDNTLNDNSGSGFTLTNNNLATFAVDVPGVCGAAASINPRRMMTGLGM